MTLDAGEGLTEAKFEAFLKSVMEYNRAPQPRVLVVNQLMKKVLEDWARTVVLVRTANYAKYELDGRVWWARTSAIDGSRGSWPRYDPEVWDARQIYNRHWRRRGYDVRH